MRHSAVDKSIYKFFVFYKELRFTFFYFCRLPFAGYGKSNVITDKTAHSVCMPFPEPLNRTRKSGTENVGD